MSSLAIPDTLLKKLRCSQCKSYLSMAPIGIDKNQASVCRNCWTLSTIRNKPFEELAALHSFPCCYRTNGCLQYVEFNNAVDHENKCIFRSYNCPVSLYSICKWQGLASQIRHHYKMDHPGLCLMIPHYKICLDKDFECYYLIEQTNVVLLLQTKYCSEKKKLWLNAVGVEGVEDKSSIKWKIKLNDKNSKRTIELEERNSVSIRHLETICASGVEVDGLGLLTIFKQPIYCSWSVNFQRNNLINLITDQDHYGNSVKCPQCNLFMVPPIYRCPLSHLTCNDCKGYNKRCEICNKSNLEFTRAIDLENIALRTQFLCRWRKCQKVFYYNQIKNHERECNARVYRCPECEQTIKSFEQISSHFKTEHSQVSLKIIEDIFRFPIKCSVYYVLVHKEIFKVICALDVMSMWTVNITYFGFPSLESYFRYEIIDCSNFLYYASKCSNNCYKATQSNYCAKVRSEYFLMVKFCKQDKTNNWIPFDCAGK